MSARSFSEALPSLPPSGLDLKPQAQEITRKLSRFFETNERLSEAWLASFLAASIEGDLYLGSSLTIRNFDRYAATSDRIGRVYSNRGASGIDGNIATALGCAGEGPGSVMTAVIGDLAALHDLNSLALLKESAQEARQESKKTLRLIVVNNDGGGIFSFLQVAKENPAFEKFWGTPHGLNFEKLAAAFDLPYTSVRSRSQLKSAVGRRARTEIIEVFTTRAENIDESARILEALRAAT
jgi:2-succinyl-5-enolpyruvyl-6-hydroxy-3-cyclohexene-1-carboxylate synthase